MQRPKEIMIPMKITIGVKKKERKSWLVAHILPEEKEISFSIPRREIRKEEMFFQRLGQELWEMAKIYCLPKLKGNLKETKINDGVTDAEDEEDGYMTAAIMWQRAVGASEGVRVANDPDTMERNAILIMMAVEQQKIWEEPFYAECRKGIFKFRQPKEDQE